MTASLAYRTNEAAILRGEVPAKYTRLLPYIPGSKILEIGSAEGVLACLLAQAEKTVTALEKSRERHDSALKLYGEWAKRASFRSPIFINGEIGNHLGLLRANDTLVAVRVIYYLGDTLDKMIAAGPKNVVLCGNRNRANWWRQAIPTNHDKADNYYASAEGMRDVLTRYGYQITQEVTDGDPIVVGCR